MSTVLDQAQNIGGIVSAARARERWQQQEAKATDPERREQLREAIADLEARFPELEDVGPGQAEAFARERGHGSAARSPVHDGRRRRAAAKRAESAPSSPSSSPSSRRSPASSPTRAPSSSSPTRAPSSRRAPSGLDRRVDRSSRRLFAQTGIPSAWSSGTSLTMTLLGATVGLSLLYLLLSSAETPGAAGRALPELLGSVSRIIHRLVSLQDPLGSIAPSLSETLPSHIGPGEAAALASGLGGATYTNPRHGLPRLKSLPRPPRRLRRDIPRLLESLPQLQPLPHTR